MTLTELEVRVATLEQKLAAIAEKVEVPGPDDLNGWIDQIHGTFQDDSTYRQAARLGQKWRRSHRNGTTPRARRTAGK